METWWKQLGIKEVISTNSHEIYNGQEIKNITFGFGIKNKIGRDMDKLLEEIEKIYLFSILKRKRFRILEDIITEEGKEYPLFDFSGFKAHITVDSIPIPIFIHKVKEILNQGNEIIYQNRISWQRQESDERKDITFFYRRFNFVILSPIVPLSELLKDLEKCPPDYKYHIKEVVKKSLERRKKVKAKGDPGPLTRDELRRELVELYNALKQDPRPEARTATEAIMAQERALQQGNEERRMEAMEAMEALIPRPEELMRRLQEVREGW